LSARKEGNTAILIRWVSVVLETVSVEKDVESIEAIQNWSNMLWFIGKIRV
jgi:hypothetical protein